MPEGHNTVDMATAIMRSADMYFYDLVHRLGIDHVHEYLTRFELGHPTGLDSTGDAQRLTLLIAFAPTEQPRIAVAVIVENGGGSGRAARRWPVRSWITIYSPRSRPWWCSRTRMQLSFEPRRRAPT